MQSYRILVSGLVQGVGYRNWTQEQAQRLGLVGWVRNLSDGRVEIMASGDPGALEALRAACREGPDAAEVFSVFQREEEEPVVDTDFTVRPTI